MPFIARAYAAGQLRTTGWPSHVHEREASEAELQLVDAALQSFYRVNTEADYRQLQAAMPGKLTAAGDSRRRRMSLLRQRTCRSCEQRCPRLRCILPGG